GDFTIVSDFTNVEIERTTGYNRARQIDCKLSADAKADKLEGAGNGGGRVSVEAVECRNSIVDLASNCSKQGLVNRKCLNAAPVRMDPAKSKVPVRTSEPTFNAEVMNVDDSTMASRSKPLNCPGEPADVELLSQIVTDAIVPKPNNGQRLFLDET